MKTEMISARMDKETKIAFTHVCDEVGLSPSQAIKLFAKAVINYGGIPFELKAKVPNRITEEAIAELEKGMGNKINSIDDLLNESCVK
jgi:DNA-damage-inducible protein J